jgi:hypothetical protein
MVSSTEVLTKLKTVGCYIELDMARDPPTYVLRKADGSEPMIIPNAIFDAIRPNLRKEGGKYVT